MVESIEWCQGSNKRVKRGPYYKRKFDDNTDSASGPSPAFFQKTGIEGKFGG